MISNRKPNVEEVYQPKQHTQQKTSKEELLIER